jgi:DNA repair protein RadC
MKAGVKPVAAPDQFRARGGAASAAAERLATYGAESLGDVELLVLASGAKIDRMLAAHDEHGGVSGLSRATVAELTPALGRRGATAVVAAFELARRTAMADIPYATPVRGPDDVARLARTLFGDLPQECFAVIGLDARQRVRCVRKVALGSVAQVDVHPREVFRPLVRAGMHATILVHNHPSGEPDPSESDIDLTRRLVEVGRVVGIPVLDHVIVTRTRAVSLAAMGAMQ